MDTFYIGGNGSFRFDEVDYKGKKQHYVTGYISTKDLDLVNDIVTEECMQDMVSQLVGNNIKLDVDHEAWREGEQGPNILPIGRIIEAKYEGGKGVWVKAVINEDSDRFQKIWNSIQGKFLDAFSIAYKAIKTAYKTVGDKQVRILDRVQLLNVALTGNPANPNARIEAVFTKSLSTINQEETQMEQEIQTKMKEEFSAAIEAEKKNFSEALETAKAEMKALFEAELKKLQETLGTKETEIKSLQEQLEKPQFKALFETKPETKTEEVAVPLKTPMQII
jgi:HK97 family phage prohead protease